MKTKPAFIIKVTVKEGMRKERRIVNFLCLIRSDKLTVIPAIKETVTQCVSCGGSVTFLSHSKNRKNRLSLDSEIGVLGPYLNCLADSCHAVA